MLMFSKVSVKSFVYDMIDVFMFPNAEIQNIYGRYKINCCYLNQNLTDTDSTSLFFVFICDLECNVKEDEARNIMFEVILKSKILDRLDLSAESFEQFNYRNKDLKKQVDLFEIESIDKPNIITIALNLKEYYEKCMDHSDNKKHKGVKKATADMDFDSYSARLSDLTEYYEEFVKPAPKTMEQKRFQVINESMQMKSMCKVQFGQLNDKKFYFCGRIASLPFGHPYLEDLRKISLNIETFIALFKLKKINF